jgi:hypothetical protein
MTDEQLRRLQEAAQAERGGRATIVYVPTAARAPSTESGDTALPGPELVITDNEWRAAMFGARALREVAEGLRLAGAADLAAETSGYADDLVGLGRRATVAATRQEGHAAGDATIADVDPVAASNAICRHYIEGDLEAER